MIKVLAAGYLTLAIVHLLTYLAVITRHAVPRSPFPFHIALTPFMLGGAFVLVVLGVGAVAQVNEIWGVSIVTWRSIRLWSEVGWLAILLYYAYWHFTHARNDLEREEEDELGPTCRDLLEEAAQHHQRAAQYRKQERPLEQADRVSNEEHIEVTKQMLEEEARKRAQERESERQQREAERELDRQERREERQSGDEPDGGTRDAG